MTPNQFKAWRNRLGLSRKEAGTKLGLSASTIQLYENGKRFDTGAKVSIPKTVEVTCRVIEQESSS